jgi:Tol biopolymer transport system component
MVRLVVALAAALAVAAGFPGAGAGQPGGGEIVFVARKHHANPHLVFAVRGDGNRLRQVPVGKTVTAYWSPNGKRVALVGAAITIADADGGNAVKLKVKCAGECDVAWSPSNERLVYTVVDDCGKSLCPSHLVAVHANGKNRHVLLRFTAAGVVSPSWSPDGRLIAFVEEASGVADLDVVRPDGSAFTRLAPADGATYYPEYHPSWTAGSKRILFSARRGGTVRVLSISRTGGDLRTLATGSFPVVSPDGKRVAFLGKQGAYVMPVAGGKQTRVATGVVSALAWSPDSSRLAYVAKGHRVGVAPVDGSGGRVVTKAYDDLLCVDWRKT